MFHGLYENIRIVRMHYKSVVASRLLGSDSDYRCVRFSPCVPESVAGTLVS